jgi:PhnB protein
MFFLLCPYPRVKFSALEASMSSSVNAVPPGFHTVTASITCKDAARAIQFYKDAFGAVERLRMASPDGRVNHAELQIGDSIIFMGDEFPGMTAAPAADLLPSQSIYLYVKDVDSLFNQAVGAGCKESMPVTDMFWGDRYGKVIDPFGHHWGISTHVEDVSPEEMDRRAAEWMAQMNAKAMAAGQS